MKSVDMLFLGSDASSETASKNPPSFTSWTSEGQARKNSYLPRSRPQANRMVMVQARVVFISLTSVKSLSATGVTIQSSK